MTRDYLRAGRALRLRRDAASSRPLRAAVAAYLRLMRRAGIFEFGEVVDANERMFRCVTGTTTTGGSRWR